MKTYFFYGSGDPLTRAELALTDYIVANGKDQTQADAKNGKLKYDSYQASFRFVIPNNQAGKVVLFDQTKNFSEGSIPEEWDKGVLQEGTNIAIDHMSVGFVADAVIAAPQAGVAYATQPNGWPAALRNARFAFIQGNGQPFFVQARVLGSQAASFAPAVEGDGYELQAPIIFREKAVTRIELWIPAGQSFGAPAGANLLELNMTGSWMHPRS